MTVAKQPAVYTHQCDRCGVTTTSDDGDASNSDWRLLVGPFGARLAQREQRDLCESCAVAHEAFMRGEPLQGLR